MLDVEGMEYLLGFRLNTISKGLLVSYTLRDAAPELIAPGAQWDKVGRMTHLLMRVQGAQHKDHARVGLWR